MKLDFAFICDYAEATRKINALGIGFDTIYAPKVPCKHPSFFLVIQLRANVVEAGEKNLEVRLIDEDGKDIIPAIGGKFSIPKPSAGTESIGRIAMQFGNGSDRRSRNGSCAVKSQPSSPNRLIYRATSQLL